MLWIIFTISMAVPLGDRFLSPTLACSERNAVLFTHGIDCIMWWQNKIYMTTSYKKTPMETTSYIMTHQIDDMKYLYIQYVLEI